MDEFARMMLRDGVRPLGARAPQSKAQVQTQAAPAAPRDPEATTAAQSSGPAWVGGQEARRTLESAIAMIEEDRNSGKSVWITGIRQDGRSVAIRAQAGLGEIVGQADRENLRLIVLGGDAWTCVMHPEMGIATIESDAI